MGSRGLLVGLVARDRGTALEVVSAGRADGGVYRETVRAVRLCPALIWVGKPGLARLPVAHQVLRPTAGTAKSARSAADRNPARSKRLLSGASFVSRYL